MSYPLREGELNRRAPEFEVVETLRRGRTMKVAVVVASVGRPKELGDLIAEMRRQTMQPSAIVVSVESNADLPEGNLDPARVIFGSRGSSVQRNRGIDLVADEADVVAFFDDDYLPSKRVIEGIARLFASDQTIAGATGTLLADGIGTTGISFDDAMARLAAYDGAPLAADRDEVSQGTYGCNMAFRLSALKGLRFDENLPLYGWQEDYDFARRVSANGRIVKSTAFVGVHRGVTIGRTSGVRFGYSQVVNPIYLWRKGTMALSYSLWLISRNILKNHVRTIWPERHIDRAGRLKGNYIALADLLRGRCDPRRILDGFGR